MVIIMTDMRDTESMHTFEAGRLPSAWDSIDMLTENLTINRSLL